MKNLSVDSNLQSETAWIDLRGLFYGFLDHKWMILAITLVSVVSGILYASMKTPLFQANILLQVANKQQNRVGMLNTLSQQLNIAGIVKPYQMPFIDFFFPKNNTSIRVGLLKAAA